MQIAYTNGKVTVGIDIKGEKELIWEILTDTELWHRWGPSVKKVRSESRFIHSGAKGQVKTAIGLWLPFHILSYKEKQFWNWQVLGVEATGHKIEELENGYTRLIFSMPWWSAPYSIVCMVALSKIRKLVTEKTYSAY